MNAKKMKLKKKLMTKHKNKIESNTIADKRGKW